MADGLNSARAMRIAEIASDFRTLQTTVAAIRANPSAEDYNEEGYVLLRRCVAESQVLLIQPFHFYQSGQTNEEQVKQQLRRIITDAAIRRFQARKIYFSATAALRWINARNAILQGQRPTAAHQQGLQAIRMQLRQEVAGVTDGYVYNIMQQSDRAEGKWLAEDPTLTTIQQAIRAGYHGL